MSELSKQALKVENNTSFPNNNSGLITPQILRDFNTDMIDSLVDEIGYTADSASWNQQINALEVFTASFTGSATNTGSLLLTASATNNVITFTKGDASTFNITVNTGSAANISALNQATASLQAFTASAEISITNLNASSASQQVSINNLNTTTASLNTSASLALYTASFNSGTRNLTFTKGDNQTFSVNIPDVSGSAGDFVTTSSFNAYTASNNQRVSSLEVNSASVNTSINNINTTTASLLIETQNLELFSASALTSLSNLNTATASLFTSTSLSLYSASVSGQLLSFTKGNNSVFSVTLPTGSGTIVTGSYGAFQDSTTQSGSANTAYRFKFNTTDVSDGVILSGSTGLKVGAYGTYNLEWSGQAVQGSGAGIVSVWVNVNGIQVSGSRGDVTLPSNTKLLPAWNYFLTLNALDVVELYWASDSGNTTWQALPIGTAPTTPAAASIIATLARVDVGGGTNSVSTSSFNAYTSSNDQKVNSLISATGSYATTGSNTFTGYQTIQNNGLDILGETPGILMAANAQGSGSKYPFGTIILDSAAYSIDGVIGAWQVQDSPTTQSVSLGINTYSSVYGFPNPVPMIYGQAGVFNPGDDTLIGFPAGRIDLWRNTNLSGSLNVTGSLISSGNNTFTGNQTITGQLSISSSAQYDLDITGAWQATAASRVSGSLGTATIAQNAVTVASGSGLNLLNTIVARGYISTSSGSSNQIALYSGISSIGGFSAAKVGGGIAVSSGSAGLYYFPIEFETATAYTDGRVTFNNPISASAGFTASLQNGFAWVGNSLGQNTQVSTSSFGTTINTGSFATTGSNAFFGTNTFSGAVSFSGSAPSILSSSFSGSLITNLTDIYTDVSPVQQIVTLTSASYAGLASGSLLNPNTLYVVSGSTSGGGGAGFPFTGDAVITGSLLVSGSNIPDVRVIGNIDLTGSMRVQPITLSVTSQTASIDMNRSNYFILNLPTSSTTHVAFTNIIPGESINLLVSQSATVATGSIAFAPNIYFPGGNDYVATATGSAKDIVSFITFNTAEIYATNVKNLR